MKLVLKVFLITLLTAFIEGFVFLPESYGHVRTSINASQYAHSFSAFTNPHAFVFKSRTIVGTAYFSKSSGNSGQSLMISIKKWSFRRRMDENSSLSK